VCAAQFWLDYYAGNSSPNAESGGADQEAARQQATQLPLARTYYHDANAKNMKLEVRGTAYVRIELIDVF
jgi:hypothetical protein